MRFRRPPDKIIGPEDDPYLLRWHIFRIGKLPRIYVHRFMRSDDDRALHDHPWWFVSILFRGEYTELREDGIHVRKAPSIAFRPLNTRHRVLLHRNANMYPVRTLIITGRDVRGWGFWCPTKTLKERVLFGRARFVPWREFDGCGE